MAAFATTRSTCTLICSGVCADDAVAPVSVTPARVAKVESFECSCVSTATRSVANSASVVPGAAATVSATTTDEAEDATAPGGKGGCEGGGVFCGACGGWRTASFPPPIPLRTTTRNAVTATLATTPPTQASIVEKLLRRCVPWAFCLSSAAWCNKPLRSIGAVFAAVCSGGSTNHRPSEVGIRGGGGGGSTKVETRSFDT